MKFKRVLEWNGRDDAKWAAVCAHTRCGMRKIHTIKLTISVMKVWQCMTCQQRFILIINTEELPGPDYDIDTAS